MRSARGGRATAARWGTRSMRQGSWPTGHRSTAWWSCGRRCCARPETFVETLTEKLLTYAVGRGLGASDMPVVRSIVRDAAPRRLPVLVAGPGYRLERAVSDADQGLRLRAAARARRASVSASSKLEARRGASDMFITKLSLPRRTILRGMGATLALPLLDAMVPALTATAQTAAQSAAPLWRRVRPDGRAARATGRRRRPAPGFEFSADPEADREVPRFADGRLQPRSAAAGHPRRQHRHLADRHARRSAPRRRTSSPARRSIRSSPGRSAGTPSSRRSRSGPRIRPATSAPATSATAAPT